VERFIGPSYRFPMLLLVRFAAVASVAASLAACLAATGLAALTVGCTRTPAAAPAANTAPVATSSASGAGKETATRAPSVTPTPKPKPKPKPAPQARVTVYEVRASDGSLVTVAVFRGPVRYVLHNGSLDPGYAAAVRGVQAGPAIGDAERKHLLAAFNGGFKLGVGAGGYEQEGHVISPLLSGYASLIIDRSGRGRIAVWGDGAPAAGEAVYSVRQNLQPLVERGRPTAAASDWYEWGATLGGGEDVARSALGEDGAGDLLYAGSMSASPMDMAQALAGKGARIGMELDINPEWVQLDIAPRPGGALRTAVPGQNRPADQYIWGWSRDFITVLAG
jgi:hypothetical protein